MRKHLTLFDWFQSLYCYEYVRSDGHMMRYSDYFDTWVDVTETQKEKMIRDAEYMKNLRAQKKQRHVEQLINIE